MKITNLKLYKVPPRWLFLKIETDEGIAGWGEPIVEGRAETVRAAVLELSDYLVGKDPSRIEDLWQVMHRGGFYRGGPILTSAISGIEQALWDIKGKRLGVPVYELLGGAVREKVRAYTWIGGDQPSAAVADSAREAQAAGFSAVKLNVAAAMKPIDNLHAIEGVISRIAAIREATGKGFDIAVDFHGRVSKSMAKILVRELEPFRPMFIEEPVLPEHNEALREIARHTTIPLATGERMFTRWGFKELLHAGYIDVIQPDVSHAGGIWELRKIAAMAEAYDVSVAPHCPLGPIALAASLQVDACTPNTLIQEQSVGIHYNEGLELLHYLKDPAALAIRDGCFHLPVGPGLGIEIDEEKVREADAKGHNWRSPIWRHDDGSFAEW